MATFETSEGVEIRYELRGNGPPVYICQGGPNNICDTLMADLAPLEDHLTLVFHDYRGSGASSPAPPQTYRFEQLADDLDELRQHLGHNSIAVLAHSMGGFIALNYSLRHTQHCSRLALVGTTPCATPGPMIRPILRALGPLRTAKALLGSLRFVFLWSWRHPSPERTQAMYAPMSVTQEPRRELRARVASAHPELPVDNDNAEHLMKTMNSLDLRQDLHRIERPALVIYGSRDAVMVAGGRFLASGLINVDVHVLPDIGHEPFIEAPELIFPTIIRFLAA